MHQETILFQDRYFKLRGSGLNHHEAIKKSWEYVKSILK